MTGNPPERLTDGMMKSCYRDRNFVAGWRVKVKFSDDSMRQIDVLATRNFPFVPIRTALVDRPPFLTWPHVEEDGVLCLLPNMAECNPDDPYAVAENLIHRSLRVIEELIEGSIIVRNFREEFVTYWAYKAHENGNHLFSLLNPCAPSRVVSLWTGEGIEVVGEDPRTLAQWVTRRFGPKVHTTTINAAFVWLTQPPLPDQYPDNAAELRLLANAAGIESSDVLEQVAFAEQNHVVVVFGAEGRGGPGLIAAKVSNPSQSRCTPMPSSALLSKGFRPGRIPKSILLNRCFGSQPVVRALVQRADHEWVHGRGRDPRSTKLKDCTIVVVGCGSVGAPIVLALASAGAGNIILVDYDDLSWPNVGRHPLGALSIGRNKAKTLAEQLQSNYPHIQVSSREYELQKLLRLDAELLERADLIVSATGSWDAENMLNRWHIADGRTKPVVYCWTEPHAVAGHAVVIGRGGGCFQCHIGRTGSPSFKVVKWPDGREARHEEPACGAHYTPYGPVELSYVTAMVSDVAMDCLINPPRTSFSRIYVTSESRINDSGGRWTAKWLEDQAVGATGIQLIERPWSSKNCPACAGKSRGRYQIGGE